MFGLLLFADGPCGGGGWCGGDHRRPGQNLPVREQEEEAACHAERPHCQIPAEAG